MFLAKEDYWEPACPFCKPGDIQRVPMDRILNKLEEYMARRDYGAVERHLLYWLAEARSGRDERGAFSLHNELMGHYRKVGNGEKALLHADSALALLPAVGADTIGAGTCYVNCGTVCDAFGQYERSLALFRKAEENYEKNLPPTDTRRGGLYNNMALVLTALQQYEEANTYFARALAVMAHAEHGELEQAITYLNMADTAVAMVGYAYAEDVVAEYLATAQTLLNTPALPRDGYHAFVCEKCAPSFDYYGWFDYATELKERARDIYERS